MIYKILVIALITFNFSYSQNGVLKGKVFDSKTKLPIGGAVVFVSNNYHYTTSSGSFEVKIMPAGQQKIKISNIGYSPITENIFITDSEITEKNYFLESAAIELGEVLISSRRTENYLKNSPYSENLIEKNEIQSKPFFTLSDILKHEPGINLMRDGVWGTDINLRGLSKQNVVALIDGNRIETATDISARLSMIDMNDIERVEIIKGAASSIYGSGATGGIINVVTRKPGLYDSFSVSGNLSGGYNSVNNSQFYSGGIFGGVKIWSSKISGSFRKAGDINTPAGKIKNSRFKDYSLNGSVNFIPFENQSLKFNYEMFKAEDVGIPGATSLFPSKADVRYPEEKRNLFSVEFHIKNISRLFNKILIKYAYQKILRSVENIPYIVQNIPASNGQPAKRVSVLKITPSANHYYKGLHLQTLLTAGNNHSINTGIDYWERKYSGERQKYQKIETLDAQGNTVNIINKVTGEKPLPDSKFRNIGYFAQDDFRIIPDKLSLSFGVRIDMIDVTGEATKNPLYEITNGVIVTNPANQKIVWSDIAANDISYSSNAGLLYALTRNVDITLSLGYSFRSPSLEERFQFIDLGNLVRLGNPSLKSEIGKSADLGIRYYSSNIKIISSLFYNHFSDLVIERPAEYEGRAARIKDNAGRARLYGFDLSIDFKLGIFLFYSNAAYVKGDDLNEGTNLPEIPPLNGLAGLRYELTEKYSAEFNSQLFAAQNKTLPGEFPTPGYAVFNFIVTVKSINFAGVNFNITSGIENIFDKLYRNHLSSARGSIAIEPGRNFFLKIITNL